MLLSASLEVLGDFLEVEPNITDNVFYWKHDYHDHHPDRQLFGRWQWWDWQLGGRGNKRTGGAGELILGNMTFRHPCMATWFSSHPGFSPGQQDFHLFSFFCSQWFSCLCIRPSSNGSATAALRISSCRSSIFLQGSYLYCTKYTFVNLHPLNNKSINQNCSSSAEEVWRRWLLSFSLGEVLNL